jgi:HEAT repeat protein
LQSYKDGNDDFCENIVLVLGSIPTKDSNVWDVLLKALINKKSAVRIAACKAIARKKHIRQRSVILLAELMRDDPNPEVCLYASKALQGMGPKALESMDILKTILKSNDSSNGYDKMHAIAEKDMTRKGLAALVLGSIGPKAQTAVPYITNMLNTPYYQDRLAAVIAMVNIGQPRNLIMEALIKASDDDKPAVANVATQAFIQIMTGDEEKAIKPATCLPAE